MKKLLGLIVTLLLTLSLFAQVPQGFSYQAIARDNNNQVIENMEIDILVGILSDTITPLLVWEEEHSVTTNSYGLFTLTIGDPSATRNAGSAQSFEDIDWTGTPLYIRTKVFNGAWYEMRPAMLWSVPYAMLSDMSYKDLSSPFLINNDTVYIMNNLSVGSDSPMKAKLSVRGSDDLSEDALFEVKRADGQTVFAVYSEGVRVFVPTDPATKGPKGGFAIGGFDRTKGEYTEDYMSVTADSIRMYIDKTPGGKGPKGGFAIGGFDRTKNIVDDYIVVNADSTRFYIDNTNAKGPKGGFAIGGFDRTKGNGISYFDVATDTTGIINPSQNRVSWYPLKNAFITGKVLVESTDSVGTNSMATGFESKSIGDYSQALGYKAIARGDYSTAIGKNALADEVNSFAFGEDATALNGETYAIGRGAIASGYRSFAFGSAGVDSLGAVTDVTRASGDYSFAIGQGSQAYGFGSFTIGLADTASGRYSTAIGYKVAAIGEASLAVGKESKALEFASFSSGYKTKAVSKYSTALGYYTYADGYGSLATGLNTMTHGHSSTTLGSSTKAYGDGSLATGIASIAYGKWSMANGYVSITYGQGSVAFGDHTVAAGDYSMTIGTETSTQGTNSIAIGYWANAGGANSMAVGDSTDSHGDNSIAIGYQSETWGENSIAAGYETEANSYCSAVFGRYNFVLPASSNTWVGDEQLFVVGNGTSNTTRDNALTILKNGNTGIGIVNPGARLHVYGNSYFTNGNVGIGTINPLSRLSVYANNPGSYAMRIQNDGNSYTSHGMRISCGSDGTSSNTTYAITFLDGNHDWVGSISIKDHTVHYNTTSDRRLKTEIKGTAISGIDLVNSIPVVDFSFKDSPDKTLTGFIAQDVLDVVPDAVSQNEQGLYQISYPSLIPVLTKALQEQQQLILEKDQKIKSLEERLEQIESILGITNPR